MDPNKPFKDLIDKKLQGAKPLSKGMGLFRQNASLIPFLHPDKLPQEMSPLLARPATEKQISISIEEFEDAQETVNELKTQIQEIETQISIRPWLAQLMDSVCLWTLFLVFPFLTITTLDIADRTLIFMPSVLFIFFLFYMSLYSCYLWFCHYFDLPTLGMQFQNMHTWPENWRWKKRDFFPAIARAFGHLTLDSKWNLKWKSFWGKNFRSKSARSNSE